MTRIPKALVLSAALAAAGSAHAAVRPDVVLPFESANLNIYVRVTVAQSRPLWFLLDTGVKPVIMEVGIARSLGLALTDSIAIGGGGAAPVTGYLLRDCRCRVVGLADFEAPVAVALPLDDLSRASGRQIAGVLGGDFLRHFVVGIDYVRHTITLHDTAWSRPGGGAMLPITFNAAGHPEVRAQVVGADGASIEGTFVVDLGSGASVILNRPFVEERRLLRSSGPTVPWLEGRGIGGAIAGSVGRLPGLRLGRFLIRRPVVIFSEATSGPFASAEAQGNIGAAILEKFDVLLDYPHMRIVLERNRNFAEALEYNRSGLSLSASGPGYRTYTIDAVAAGSLAAAAGLAAGDTLVALDGRSAGGYSLSEIRMRFRHAKRCSLTAARGDRRVRADLALRSPI